MATAVTFAPLPTHRIISRSLNLLHFLRSHIEVHKCTLEPEPIIQLVVKETVRLVSITSMSDIPFKSVFLKHFKIPIGIFCSKI